MSSRMLKFPKTANLDEWSGERFVVGRTGDIEFEHYHRYLFATQFCAGRDVLDIACGEGYGSFVLSQVARQVTGIDVAAEVVAAAQQAYGGGGLSFRHGSCQAIGLPDASVDVAVSFETIEHIVEHDAFMAELRRVLRPGGLLLVSTPDRVVYSPPGSTPNPFHLRELTLPEFSALIAANFKHHAMGAQKATSGSVLLPVEAGLERLEVFHRHDEEAFEASPALLQAPYLVAIASDAPLPEIRWGLLDDTLFLHGLQHRVMDSEARLNAEVGRLDQEILRLNAAFAVSEAEIQRLNAAFAEREAEVSRLNAAYAERADEVSRLRAAYTEREAAVSRLNAAYVQRDAEVSRLNVALAASLEDGARWKSAYGERQAEIALLAGEREKVSDRERILAAQLAEQEARLQEVWNSSSWRLTRPLRVLKRALLEGPEGRARLRAHLTRGEAAANPASLPEPVISPDVSDAHGEAAPPRRSPPPGTGPLILVVTHDCSRTGAPMLCLNLLKELARRGGSRIVCVALRSGEMAADFIATASLYDLGARDPRLTECEEMARLLAEWGEVPAVAFCNTVVTAPVIPALTAAGVQVISLVHELPTSILALGEETIRTIQSEASIVVYSSEYGHQRVVEAFGTGTAAEMVIPTGYPEPLTPESMPEAGRARLIEAAGLPADARIILACGTVDHRKGPDLFVQVAARMLRSPAAAQAHFVWIGHMPQPIYLAWLEHDAALLGIADRVHFLGGVSDVDQFIPGADVFLLTSREDPCPLVNLAALGSGVPAIAFAEAGGAPEAIRDDAGFVVPYQDTDAMADAALALLGDEALRQRLGSGGRRRFSAQYEIGVFTDRLLRLLPAKAD